MGQLALAGGQFSQWRSQESIPRNSFVSRVWNGLEDLPASISAWHIVQDLYLSAPAPSISITRWHDQGSGTAGRKEAWLSPAGLTRGKKPVQPSVPSANEPEKHREKPHLGPSRQREHNLHSPQPTSGLPRHESNGGHQRKQTGSRFRQGRFLPAAWRWKIAWRVFCRPGKCRCISFF